MCTRRERFGWKTPRNCGPSSGASCPGVLNKRAQLLEKCAKARHVMENGTAFSDQFVIRVGRLRGARNNFRGPFVISSSSRKVKSHGSNVRILIERNGPGASCATEVENSSPLSHLEGAALRDPLQPGVGCGVDGEITSVDTLMKENPGWKQASRGDQVRDGERDEREIQRLHPDCVRLAKTHPRKCTSTEVRCAHSQTFGCRYSLSRPFAACQKQIEQNNKSEKGQQGISVSSPCGSTSRCPVASARRRSGATYVLCPRVSCRGAILGFEAGCGFNREIPEPEITRGDSCWTGHARFKAAFLILHKNIDVGA